MRFIILIFLFSSVAQLSGCAKYRVTKSRTANPSVDDGQKFGEPAHPIQPQPDPISTPIGPREEISGNQITVYGDGFYIQSFHTAEVGECVPFNAYQCGPNNSGEVFWNFGDGYTEVGPSFEKGYEYEGEYQVTATCRYPGQQDQTLGFTLTITSFHYGCN